MNFGIISLGNHAINRVAPAILESGSTISVIYTRDRKKGEKYSRIFGASYVDNFDDAVKKDFDAAYISSPNYLHYIHAKKCMESGKDILLEKPVTLDESNSVELDSISKREGIKFGIGFHLRFHPAFEEIKKVISRGEIGKPKIAYGKWSTYSPTRDDDSWWSNPEQAGGGAIVGRGVHVMDSFVNLFGRGVESLIALDVPRCKVIEDTMQTSVLFKDGIIANSLSSRVISPDSNNLQIFGENGAILVTNAYDTKVDSKVFLNGKIIREFGVDYNVYLEEIKGFINNDSRMANGEDGILSTKMHLRSKRSGCDGKVYSI
jgi:predicted dehydrogenase